MLEEKELDIAWLVQLSKSRAFAVRGIRWAIGLNSADTTRRGCVAFFYHDIFPYIIMLQFGGAFAAEWGDPDVVKLGYMDKTNAVKIGRRRIKE